MKHATAGSDQRVEERSETCPQHGEFTAQRICVLGQPFRLTGCPGCEQANLERVRVLEEQQRIADIASRIERARIPERFRTKTLENFQVENEEQRISLALAREYVAEFSSNLKTGRCLVFCGGVGTGKTHLACGIAQALIPSHSVLYAPVRDLIRDLRDTWRRNSDTTETELLRRLRDLPLLVLDEVGAQFGTDAEKIQLFDVINARYGAQRPTLFVSNLGINGLRALLGERVIDRLRENDGRMLLFRGQSWRSKTADLAHPKNHAGEDLPF
jgi:DNA replication protein DnaC